MKALILSLGLTLAWLLTVIAIFHARPIEARSKTMALGFGVWFLLALPAYLYLPPNLGILESRWSQTPIAAGLLQLAALAIAWFITVYQVYFYIDRPITFRMFAEIDQAKTGKMTFDELNKLYSLEYMVEKRFNDMARNDLLTKQGNHFVLSARGRRLARIFYWFKRLLDAKLA